MLRAGGIEPEISWIYYARILALATWTLIVSCLETPRDQHKHYSKLGLAGNGAVVVALLAGICILGFWVVARVPGCCEGDGEDDGEVVVEEFVLLLRE